MNKKRNKMKKNKMVTFWRLQLASLYLSFAKNQDKDVDIVTTPLLLRVRAACLTFARAQYKSNLKLKVINH